MYSWKRKQICKSPKVRESSAYLRNSSKVSVTTAEKEKENEKG